MRSPVFLIVAVVLVLSGTLSPFRIASGISRLGAPAQEQATVLNLGQLVERELKGGEAQEFTVGLPAGQFLHVEVQQVGIDVEVTLLGPDKQKLLTIDSPNDQYGPELVVWESVNNGEYTLQVRSPNQKSLPGRFQIKLVGLHSTTPQDRYLIAAARAFEEAQKLRSQRTAPARAAAITKFENALSEFVGLGNDYWSGLSLHSIGSTYVQSSEFAKALAAFDRALPRFRAAGDKRREAGVYNFIGGIHDILGNQSQALAGFQKALAIFEQVEDPSTKASVLNNLGKVHSDLNHWQVSLDYYNQALPLLHVNANPAREASAIYNIGLLYYRLGDTERTLANTEQALKLFRLAEDKGGQADTLSLIGLVHVTRGESERGLNYYSQALELFRATGNARGEATTLDYSGVAYASLNQLQKALENHQQALQLRRKIADRRNEALSLANLGHVYFLLNDSVKAQASYQEALLIFRALADGNNAARSLVGLAKVQRSAEDLVAARKSVEEALALIEEVRSSAGSQQLRASYFASRQEPYKLYIDLLMKQHGLSPERGYSAQALAVSERARARSLLELLNEAQVDIRKGVNPELIDRERNLAQLLNAKAQRQIRLLAQKNVQEQLNEVNKELRELEDEYRKVQTSIRSSSPGYAALTQPQPLKLQEIQGELDSNTLLLEYSLGEERSYLWLVSKAGLRSYELPNQRQIEKHAREVYSLLTSRSSSVSGETVSQKEKRIVAADAKLPAASAELSRLILGPVATELQGKRLVIVAEGALQFIPFAALPAPHTTDATTSNQYRALILDHEMISLPSASAFAVQRKNLIHRKPAVKALAVIADPVFSLSDDRFRNRGRKNGPRRNAGEPAYSRSIEHLAGEDSKLKIKRLPFTRQEADRIFAVSPQPGNLKATDFKANRSIATGPELSKYRYVHFATHGYLDSERPDLSAIVLSLVDQTGQPEDGFLRAHEIFNLTLPAELVVLSACQTGLGKEIKGEGLVGLTQGFMYAGARRVVVSLWNVNDKATADLMQRFYYGMLKEQQSPSAALRKAQAEMSHQTQWQQPYYWAAFVLQGEWN
ncbi:MAG TPA: CHAT domain-containing protein [Pyrinomonadaceae bacterium]|nr:CHAT domain-containing protein [Pyrinomonadaceae bacterium]